MRTETRARALAVVGAIVGLVAMGCHADPDDVAGQARELADPVRRENAIANLSRLYHAALDANGGNREAPAVRAVADQCVDLLTSTLVDHPEDINNGAHILDLLKDMRDVRSLPALVRSLDWRPEISEEHAITAAQTIRELTLDEAQRGEVIEAVGRALERVAQNRGVDNRMRIEFLRTLGDTEDRRAAAAITRVLLLQSENQDFLINRLAAEQLGRLRDPESVPALIQALYLFGPNNPALRMNDVATAALVAIGRPALQPLIDTLAGNNADVNGIAGRYIDAVRARDADAASRMSREAIVSNESAFALGQLGFPEAIDPLIAEATQLDPGERADSIEEDLADMQRMFGAAIALVSVNRRDSDTERMRNALIHVFNRIPEGLDPTRPNRTQLLVGMQHFMDPGLLPFLLARAQRPGRGAEEDPDMRVLAFRAYMMIANADELAALNTIYTAEPEGDTRDGFNQFEPEATFAAIRECGSDLACWQRKLTDTNAAVAQKAAYMVARYGRGDAGAITAIVGALSTRDEAVMGEILYALDYTATTGSAEAVARIDQLESEGGGTAFWNHIQSLAVVVRARVRARGASGG